MPGPAAYGRGGEHATVTDADVVLGYISPEHFAAGRMELRPELARDAVGRLAAELGLGLEETAAGIYEVVNHVMADAIRVRTVERGSDPRDFALLSFGGAGGLHCVDVARTLGMRRIVVPPNASTFSALSLTVSDLIDTATVTRHLAVPAAAADVDPGVLAQVNDVLDALAERGRGSLAAQGARPDEIHVACSVQLCYQTQVLDLEVPVGELPLSPDGLVELTREFDARYLRAHRGLPPRLPAPAMCSETSRRRLVRAPQASPRAHAGRRRT